MISPTTATGGPRISRAFSLIELLVALAVVAVLATLMVYAIDGGRNAAQSTKCLSNVRQIGMLHLAYAADNDGALITAQADAPDYYWYNQLDKGGYIDLQHLRDHRTEDSIFLCPSRELPHETLWMQSEYMHYGANMYPGFHNRGKAKDHKLSNLQNPGQTFLVAEINSNFAIWQSMIRAAYPHSGHINMFFADGSARRLKGPLPPLPEPAPVNSNKDTFPFY